jgi:cysteine desulfurase
MARAVYLDHNATTPIRPEAARAVVQAMEIVGNSSSVHRFGRLARRLVEDAREAVAALAGTSAGRVIFTSGGTEANNLALRGSGRPRLLVSAGEHDSVLQAVPEAERIPLTGDGRVDPEEVSRRLAADPRPALVSVMLANNETGVIQPIEEIAARARRAGALVHCDAVQAAGKIPLDLAALDVDLMSLSAHKLGGPQGVGALLAAEDLGLRPLLRGGGQERGRRAGTENLPGIAGFGAAAQAAAAELAGFGRVARLRDDLEGRVIGRAPAAKIFGAEAPRLANTSCLTMPGVGAETQVMALDLAGVAVSAGSACSSGKVRPSHVLAAMGVAEAEAGWAIRVSLGRHSQAEDIEAFLEAWTELYNRTRRQAPAGQRKTA